MVQVWRLFIGEEGADASEYALMAALIALVIIVGASALGMSIGNFFTALATYIGAIQVA